MPRTVSPQQVWRLYQAIQQHPGSRPAELARILGWHRSQVMRVLPHLDDYGLRLFEDDEGRLYPFHPQVLKDFRGLFSV